MTSRRASAPRLRSACALGLVFLLAACAGHPQKKAAPLPVPASAPTHAPTRPPARKPWKSQGPYTPGGLYAPGVADGAPDVAPDVANLPEPVPHAEPLSRYGNRSPYVVLDKTYTVLPSAAGYVERGIASWYGTKFDGRATSSFESYDMYQFTAAHRTLPLPSYARVTNLDNGRSVIVRINDRGPFHEGRLIDLSYAAAIKLGVNVHGTAPVEVRGIDPGQPLSPTSGAWSAASRSVRAASVSRPAPASNAMQGASHAAMEPVTFAPHFIAADGPGAEMSVIVPDIAPRPAIEPATLGFLQVASYSDRGNADRMVERLQQAGIAKVELISVQIDGQTLWRVHVGPLRADDAERVADRLDALGFGHPPFFKD